MSTMPLKKSSTRKKNETATPSPPSLAPLPTKHSIKASPPVCHDPLETIIERIDELCAKPVGSLFTYQAMTAVPPGTATQSINVAHDQQVAWDAADVTVQEWEYLLRGLAAQIPGTITWKQEQPRAPHEFWAAGVSHEANPPVPELDMIMNVIVPKMILCMERIQQEGQAYMRVRADRLTELYPLLEKGDFESEEEAKLWGASNGSVELLEDGSSSSSDKTENGPTEAEMAEMLEGSENMQTPLDDFKSAPRFDGQKDDSASLSSVGDEDPNRLLTEQETKFLVFLNADREGSFDGKTYGELSQGQQQQLQFLKSSSPEMSQDEEERLLKKLEEDPMYLDRDLTDEERYHKKFMEQFASPGPTLEMYNTLLDALALCASEIKDPYTLVYHNDFHPRMVEFWFQKVLERFEMDGGEDKNNNPHTVPNIVTFNAIIRLCAGLPYEHPEGSNENGEKSFFSSLASLDPKYTIYRMQRDEALVAAVGAFDRLTHIKVADWSPATFAYMLRILGKYLPVGEMRGNCSIAMFFHASEAGCVDGFVVRELLAANHPSNTQAHDDWIKKQGITATVDGEGKRKPKGHSEDLAKEYGVFPSGWTKVVKSQRFVNYDSTY